LGEPVVLIREPGAKPRYVPLRAGTVGVGRTKQNDLVVTGANVSREHCQLVREGDRVTLVNVSKNGTLRNGHRIHEPVVLAPGDRIAVGDVEIVLVGEGADEETPAAGTRVVGPPPPRVPDTKSTATIVAAPAEPKPAPANPAEPFSEPTTQPPEPEPEAKPPVASAGPERETPADPEPKRRRWRGRGSSRKSQAVTFLVAWIIVGPTAAIAYRIYTSQTTAPTAPPVASPDAPSLPDRPSSPSAPSEPPPPGAPEPELGPSVADRAWEALGKVPPDQLANELTSFSKKFHSDERASIAKWMAKKIGEVREDAGARREAAVWSQLIAAADGLAQEKELAQARLVLDLVGKAAKDAHAKADAAAKSRALEDAARVELEALRASAKDALDKDGPAHALALVLDARSRLRSLGVDDEVVALATELEEAAGKERPSEERRSRRGAPDPGASLREPVALTLRFDLETARDRWAALQMQPLSLEDRLHVEWNRAWCAGLERLFDDLQKAVAAGKRPELVVFGEVRGAVVKSDAKALTIEAKMDGGQATLEWPWRRLEASQTLELLETVADKDEARLALAFYAFETGHTDRAHGYLVDVIKRHKEATARVSSFLTIETGTNVPEGGFIVFEGRLVPPAERDKVLLARKQAKEEAAAAAKDLAQLREKPKLLRYLQRGIALCDEGSYVEGRSILQALAQRHADIPGVGDAAKARLDAPYLRRRAIEKNGPCSNRLDLYILADGFTLDDDNQRGFDRAADSLKYFVEHQDFFTEYASYLNYWAVNIASNEEGLSKEREGVKKDTALGGIVRKSGALNFDREKVFDVLHRGFPNEQDENCFCIANGDAHMATGGGGLAAIPKTFLQSAPHEFGHAFGGLGDEYDFDPSVGAKAQGFARPTDHVAAKGMAPNLVGGSEEAEVRDAAPWKHWFKVDPNWTGLPIDVFEGAGEKRFFVWRPQRTCVMRDVGAHFCAVCMERMILQLYRHVRPIDRVWPEEETIKHPKGKDLTIRVQLMAPRTHGLETRWTIEPKAGTTKESGESGGGTVAKAGKNEVKPLKPKRVEDMKGDMEGVKIPGSLLESSVVVVLEVRDPTPWVQKDEEGRLKQTRRWVVEVGD
jgi:pSer/pThr/pTyr-binding forkhead associated (FHA) protein